MKRILVIDDDIVIREIIRDILESEGFQIVEAPNGKEGIHQHKMHVFQLIITDIIMPDMEGLETIRAIKRIDKSTKILAISGGGVHNPDDYLSLARKMGADKILTKPFNKTDLSHLVHQLLGMNKDLS